MRTGPRDDQTSGVSLDPPPRVVLELDPGPGPMTGTFRDEAGTPRRFDGWLELCALLDAARITGDQTDQ
jgi:hypothetical protein